MIERIARLTRALARRLAVMATLATVVALLFCLAGCGSPEDSKTAMEKSPATSPSGPVQYQPKSAAEAPSKPRAVEHQPSAPMGVSGKPETSSTPKPEVPAGPAVKWTAEVDPQTDALEIPKNKPLLSLSSEHRVLLPRRLSPFVMRYRGFLNESDREVFDLRTGERVGVIPGELDFGEFWVGLSPDGRYFLAVHVPTGVLPVGPSAEVWGWSCETGRQIESLRVKFSGMFIGFEFPRPGKVLVCSAGGDFLELIHWDIEDGREIFRFRHNRSGQSRDRHGIGPRALSPGGRYVAFVCDGSVWLYELSSGECVGQTERIQLPEYRDLKMRFEGLGFSPDGTELAAVVRRGDLVRVICWDVATGVVAFDANCDAKGPPHIITTVSGRVVNPEWLPDKSGLILYAQALMDRRTKRLAWVMSREAKGIARVVDADHALAVVEKPDHLRDGSGEDLMFAVVPFSDIPKTEVKPEAKAVRSPVDPAAKLPAPSPTLTPPKRPRLLSLPSRVFWNAEVDPAGHSFDIPTDKECLVSLSRSHELLYPREPSAFVMRIQRPQVEFKRPKWETVVEGRRDVFDLRTGENLGTIRGELNVYAKFEALSPDGRYYLAYTGGPITGKIRCWTFPGAQELQPTPPEWPNRPTGFRFPAADLLLMTRGVPGGGSEMLLWDMKEKAFISSFALARPVDETGHHTLTRSGMALSPGGRYGVFFTNRSLFVYELRTGVCVGRTKPVPSLPVQLPELHGPRFSSDGTEVAVIAWLSQASRVFVWDFRAGDLVMDVELSRKGPPRLTTPIYRGPQIDWRPDKGGLLLYGYAMLDRSSQKIAWALKPPKKYPRFLVGSSHVLDVVPKPDHLRDQTGEELMITVAPVPDAARKVTP